MQHTLTHAKEHLINHRRNYLIGAVIVIMLGLLIALYIYNNPNKVAYAPQDACKLFTPLKAEDLLGNHVINVNTDNTTISGNIGTSKCSYTDSNANPNQMKVAALAIRSGVNDSGVAENKADFAGAKSQPNMQTVNQLGDSAFFNPTRGQLNILSGRMWLLISYGVGATPQANTIEDATTLAHKILSDRT